MKAERIDGTAIAAKLRGNIQQRAQELASRGVVPGLAVVLIGDNPASLSYVTAKEKACAENGIRSTEIRRSAQISEAELLGIIESLNRDPEIHGILVQLPLPPHINEGRVIESISPEKDVDGFHPISLGRMMTGVRSFLPCTPYGVLKIIEEIGADTNGAHVVIVGRSNIVGKPLANLFLRKGKGGDATVTVCHSRTRDLGAITRQADILVAAVGSPELIRGDMIKPGAIVIDVGVNRVPDATKKSGFSLRGDVAFDEAAEVASAITPVPRGVGPLTITMLLHNTVESAAMFLEEQIQGSR